MFSHQASNLSGVLGIQHGFMGRMGGTSPRPWNYLNASYDVGDIRLRVDENRTRIARMFSVSSSNLFTAKQVHGVTCVRVSAKDDVDSVRKIEADALWTTEKNLAVGVLTADCVPVLVASKDGQAVAAIHAGWRGATSGIAVKTIQTMAETLGLDLDQFVVAIGPCMGFEYYEVGPEVIEAARKTLSEDDLANLIRPSTENHFFIDLQGVIERQLKNVGVTNIERTTECTVLNSQHYFSHRLSKGSTGRQLSVVVAH